MCHTRVKNIRQLWRGTYRREQRKSHDEHIARQKIDPSIRLRPGPKPKPNKKKPKPGLARELRLTALFKLGGQCRCGNTDIRVLQFDHVIPMKRGTNGLSQKYDCGVVLYKRIIKGNTHNVQLLCANCHIIKTIEDDIGSHADLFRWFGRP